MPSFKSYIRLYSIKLVRQAKLLRRFHLGNPDQNLYDVGRIFIEQLKKDEISEKASAMAFSFTIAMFPLLLFLLNIIPYIGYFFPSVTTQNILMFVAEIIPSAIYNEAESTIMDIVSKPRQSLLSLGFFLALFLATNGVVSMMNAFNAVYKTKENRSFFKTRAIAVSIVFILVLSIIGAVLIMIIGSSILYAISEWEIVSSNLYYYLLAAFRFLVLLSLFTIATAYIFRFAPAVHDKWRFFSIGSLTAGLLITFGFYLFSYYLNNFANYNKLYGSIGAMIAVMLWLLITSLIILVAFEINVSLDKAADIKKERVISFQSGIG
ncbi:YihY/virulence factor BrkB family protein [Mongoliitalea daihaiensis]|uniref:YihY/virulence factor BrkB family protein n=1 Tax=Mongoliitalea daihaiensis TaxID=2782006 RepID=UPI001F3AACFE|nr:YihY/virulence factor BrkB family protein [Mongoliitalea daihaiensis]UJP63654.1 YihY/virulence factor BrkB family protein [Mongoliitalea daihaiensis]